MLNKLVVQNFVEENLCRRRAGMAGTNRIFNITIKKQYYAITVHDNDNNSGVPGL